VHFAIPRNHGAGTYLQHFNHMKIILQYIFYS